MAYCKFCDKEVEAVLKKNRYYCPDCNKYVKVDKEEREEPQVSEVQEEKPEEREPKHYKKKEQEMVQEGNTKLLLTPKTTKYDASDLHMGEILINMGYAKDLNDLTRKNMKLAFSLMNMGAVGKQFNTMENKEQPDPKKTMAQIQEQKLMESYIKSLDSGNQSDPMMTMMMMKMLENQGKGKDSGDNGFMKELMQMQMMKMFSGGDNQQTSTLQREIADLKQSMQMSQLMAQTNQTQQGNQTQQDYLMKMENIRAERDKDLKKIEVEAQKQRDKNMQLVFETKVGEIQKEMQRVTEKAERKGEKADLSSFKDQLNTVKELSTMLGEREKGAGEYISETITNVATQLQPTITQMMQQKQQQAMQQLPMAEQPQQIPQQIPEEYQEPEFQTPSDMNESSQGMAETMSSIYIDPPKEKK